MRARWLAGLAVATGVVHAQPPQTTPVLPPGTPARSLGAPRATIDTTAPGIELTVYLVTVGPGDRIWEKFGHSALWIHDGRTGAGVAYNWGLFDAAEPGFARRFVRGVMHYRLGGFDAQEMIREYTAANRSVWVQRLRLFPAQRARLRAFVEWNERPKHRFYRYDYFRDNCATRVRDALDLALGGQIRRATDTVTTDATYRWHTRRLLAGEPAAYAGVQFALGQPADRPISAWEAMFLPGEMREWLNRVRVPDGTTGRPLPLVVADVAVFRASRAVPPAQPPDRLPAALAAGVLVGAALALLGRGAGRRDTLPRVAFAAAGSLWSLASGIAGIVLLGAWTFTEHATARPNENVLQASPISLALAVLLALALRPRHAGRWAAAVAIAAAALSVAGWLAQAAPGLDQMNGEVIALALPAHLGLAWGAWRAAWRRSTRADGTRPEPTRRTYTRRADPPRTGV